MKSKPQVIFDNGQPAFVVLRYEDYVKLAGDAGTPDDSEMVPFVLSDYIKNPIRIARIESGLNQQQLARLLGVTQGYVSRIEGRSFRVTDALLNRATAAISKHRPGSRTTKRRRKAAS